MCSCVACADEEAERLRRRAVESMRGVSENMVDSVNMGVAHVFANQRKLEAEARKLQAETQRFAKQTTQWLSMLESFNVALKVRAHGEVHLQGRGVWRVLSCWLLTRPQELGDVENWAEHIEKDMNAVAAALEEIHSSKTGATQ